MTKTDYMNILSRHLRKLPREDFDHAIEYFEEYFAEAGPGQEQQAIQDLGSPEEAARGLILDLAEKNASEPPRTVKHGLSAVWIGILGVCAAPIALPVALALVAVILAVLVCLFAALLCIFLGTLSIAAAGVIGIIGGAILAWTAFSDGIATLGFSIFFLGVGLLAVYGTFHLCRWVFQKAAQTFGKIIKGGRRHEDNH